MPLKKLMQFADIFVTQNLTADLIIIFRNFAQSIHLVVLGAGVKCGVLSDILGFSLITHTWRATDHNL